MKRYQVRLTHDAEQDLVDIFNYISRKDSVDNANYVLDHLETLILSLDQQPERGHYPPELEVCGVKSFKEIHFKPYRVIYEVIGVRHRARMLRRVDWLVCIPNIHASSFERGNVNIKGGLTYE